jgi:hypothetical protein
MKCRDNLTRQSEAVLKHMTHLEVQAHVTLFRYSTQVHKPKGTLRSESLPLYHELSATSSPVTL